MSAASAARCRGGAAVIPGSVRCKVSSTDTCYHPIGAKEFTPRVRCSHTSRWRTRLLPLDGRVDDLDEPGAHVVDEAGDEPAALHNVPGDGRVDPYRRVRVGDRLALQLVHRDLEELGELLRKVREAADAAVGMVQDHQVPGRGPGRA